MRRKLLSAMKIALIPMSTMVMADAQPVFADHDRDVMLEKKLVPVPTRHSAPEVNVWTRPGEGSVLFPGQKVDVFFRTNRDAYVVVVNIDTRGYTRVLFPARRWDDGYVRGRRRVAIPEPGAGYDLRVSGPPGVERIVAFASDEPILGRWEQLLEEELSYNTGVFRLNRRDSSCDLGIDFRAGSGSGSWAAQASFTGGSMDLRMAAGGKKPRLVRDGYEPKLVPVPTCGDVSVDETWFRVMPRRGRHGRY